MNGVPRAPGVAPCLHTVTANSPAPIPGQYKYYDTKLLGVEIPPATPDDPCTFVMAANIRSTQPGSGKFGCDLLTMRVGRTTDRGASAMAGPVHVSRHNFDELKTLLPVLHGELMKRVALAAFDVRPERQGLFNQLNISGDAPSAHTMGDLRDTAINFWYAGGGRNEHQIVYVVKTAAALRSLLTTTHKLTFGLAEPLTSRKSSKPAQPIFVATEYRAGQRSDDIVYSGVQALTGSYWVVRERAHLEMMAGGGDDGALGLRALMDAMPFVVTHRNGRDVVTSQLTREAKYIQAALAAFATPEIPVNILFAQEQESAKAAAGFGR